MIGMVIGRTAAGLLAASASSLGAALVIAPRVGAGLLFPIALVAGATAVALSATSVVVWAAAIAVAVGGLVVRWLAVSPGRPTLAAARVAGLGAASIIAAAPFLATASPPTDSRSAVVAALFAIGVLALLAVAPLGGWAVGCLETLRGVELAPWALLLAPAVLVSAGALLSTAPVSIADGVRRLLLVAGLAGAVWSGVHALRVGGQGRYGRVLLADLALSAAVAGATGPAGGSAARILVLLHLCVAPVLLNPAFTGLGLARRAAWLAASGVPFTPAFWGRLLAVEACAGTGRVAPAVALAVMGVVAVATLPAVVRRVEPGRTGTVVGRVAGSLAVVAIVVLAMAPQAVTRAVFGGG